MEMWLKTSGKQFRFPVIPESFQIEGSSVLNYEHVANLGEVVVFGGTNLRRTVISSMFPAQEYRFCNYTGFPSPYECVKAIEDWYVKGQDIRFIITGTEVNILVTIESFTYGEQDCSGDVYFELSLVEYRVPTIGRK